MPTGRGGGGASRAVGGGVWRAVRRRAAGTNGGAEAEGKSSVRRSREGKNPGRRRIPEVGRPGAGGRAGSGRRGAGGGDPALGGWGWGGKRAPGSAGRAIEDSGSARPPPREGAWPVRPRLSRPRRPAAPGPLRRGLGGRPSGPTLLPASLPSVRLSGRTSLPSGCVSGPSRLPPVGHRSTPPSLPLPRSLVFLPVLFVPGLPVFPACPGSWPSP